MAWRTMLVKPTFACLENEKSSIGIIGVPLDYSGTYRPGTRFAPQKVREAACNLELYSLTANLPLEDVGFKDYGDIILPPGDITRAIQRIELTIKNITEDHKGLVIIIGGEHLLTYSTVHAVISEIDTLVVFDAHLDMRAEYLDSSLNHATFLHKLVEEGVNVIHIGSRAYSRDEIEYVKGRSNVVLFNILDVYNNRIKLSELGKTYISVDLDAFDPSIAPGVSNPEPFGLSSYMFLNILKEIFEKASDIRAIDIVEVNPLVDHSDITSILAAKIAIEATGLYLKNHNLIV
ncbi:MAG: agmatinase [Desulfurococcaceae archaeon]